MIRRAFLTSPLATLLSPAVAGSSPRSKATSIPNVPVTTHEGKTVRFYNDLVKDRIVTVNFMYAQCQGICPGMTANLVKVQAALSDRVGRDIFMYSITLKPEHDTADVLRQYAQDYKVKPGWLFLTGRPEDIETLRRGLGFVDSDPVLDADKSEHIGLVRFGNDALDRWAACPALTRPGFLAESILAMEGPRRASQG